MKFVGERPRIRWIWVLFGVALGCQLAFLHPADAQTTDAQTTDTGPPWVTPPANPTGVTITVEPKEILRIDERDQLFEIDLFLTARWLDPRIDGCAEGEDRVFLGESANEQLKSNSIWWPGFHIVEGIGQRDTSALALTVKCGAESSERMVVYEERFVATIGETFTELNDFPFDAHKIDFTIEPFSEANISRVKFTSESTATRPGTSREIGKVSRDWESDEWNFGIVSSKLGSTDPALTTTIPISRKAPWYWLSVIAPLMAIVALSWTVFWMRPEALSERMGVSTTSLLTVVAFDFLTSDNLPKLSYTTRLDAFYNVSYVAVALTVVVSLAGLTMSKGGLTRLESLLRRTQSARSDEGPEEASGESPALTETNVSPGRRLDQLSRIIFPVTYLGVAGLAFAGAFSPGRGGFDLTPWSGDDTVATDTRSSDGESESPVAVTVIDDLGDFDRAFGQPFNEVFADAEAPRSDTEFEGEVFAVEDVIEEAGDFDAFKWCGPENSPRLTIFMGLLDDSAELDPHLAVYTEAGDPVLSDPSGEETSADLVEFVPADGACYLIVASDRRLDGVGAYYLVGLDQSDAEGFDEDYETTFGMPIEAAVTTIVDQLADSPFLEASIGEISENDAYRFCASGTGPVTVTMWSTGETGLDPLLLVYDETGAFVALDDDSYGGLDSIVEFVPDPGACYVTIALDLTGESTGDYTITFDQEG